MGLLISNRRILGVARAAEKHLKRARSFENIDLVGAYYNKKGNASLSKSLKIF